MQSLFTSIAGMKPISPARINSPVRTAYSKYQQRQRCFACLLYTKAHHSFLRVRTRSVGPRPGNQAAHKRKCSPLAYSMGLGSQKSLCSIDSAAGSWVVIFPCLTYLHGLCRRDWPPPWPTFIIFIDKLMLFDDCPTPPASKLMWLHENPNFPF